MDNVGTSEQTPQVSSPSSDQTPPVPMPSVVVSSAAIPSEDIPIALRDTPKLVEKPRDNTVILAGSLSALGVAALVSGVLFAIRVQQSQSPVVATASPPPTATAEAKPSPGTGSDTLLGHFPYPEAPQAELAPIVDDGSIKLRKAAAKAYREMAAAAEAEGIVLVPISGFRSITDQQYLYFDIKKERGQVAAERAKVSAPPGYSEHHTGYAIDIGDGNVPATNLSQSFEKTPAFQWLKDNAAHYSFELSFPKNNPQKVSYEPWHWRYVGDIQSLKTFYKARGK